MTKYTQTIEDLHNHLREQLQFLHASANAFDYGFEGEAKRLATTIRVLVHDTRSSTSLLKQLNLKHPLRMCDTAPPLDTNSLTPYHSLVIMRIDAPEGASASVTFTVFGEEKPYTDDPP